MLTELPTSRQKPLHSPMPTTYLPANAQHSTWVDLTPPRHTSLLLPAAIQLYPGDSHPTPHGVPSRGAGRLPKSPKPPSGIGPLKGDKNQGVTNKRPEVGR